MTDSFQKSLLTKITFILKKSYNPAHNILALFNNLAQDRIAASKSIFDI